MKTESYKIDYALGTPSEISAFLLKDFKNPSEFTSHAKFRDCNMTVYEEFEGSLESEASRQSGWCGVKKADTGFNSDALDLVSDYYGGGSLSFCSLNPDDSLEDARNALAFMIRHTLELECKDDTTLIFVEIKEKLQEEKSDAEQK